jgi:hypothetical protein
MECTSTVLLHFPPYLTSFISSTLYQTPTYGISIFSKDWLRLETDSCLKIDARDKHNTTLQQNVTQKQLIKAMQSYFNILMYIARYMYITRHMYIIIYIWKSTVICTQHIDCDILHRVRLECGRLWFPAPVDSTQRL